MHRKARDLSVGDIFRMHVYGEVLSVASVADGKRIKVKLALENQGRRDNSGVPVSIGGRLFSRPRQNPYTDLEFTDNGHVLEFLCRPGRGFRLIEWGDDDDDDGDDVEHGPVLSPEGADL
jgi:hypothetical protein